MTNFLDSYTLPLAMSERVLDPVLLQQSDRHLYHLAILFSPPLKHTTMVRFRQEAKTKAILLQTEE